MRFRIPQLARSITLKLTVAFVLIGMVGAVLVAAFLWARTRTEFNQYVSVREQTVFLEALSSYYSSTGGWSGVAGSLPPGVSPADQGQDFALMDAKGVVVLGSSPFAVGSTAPVELLRVARPVRVDGVPVGYVAFAPPPGAPPREPRPTAEAGFLLNLTWAAALSAAIAAVLALGIGGLLARSLSRPIRELTLATRAVAAGRLGQRVTVHSRDEIGELAESFNQMSSDLARATNSRRQMTADLAHDLRTPLTILRGYTEGLQDGRLRGSLTLFQIMHGEVLHLQRLVDDLRLLSLADSGALSLNRRAVDPSALLERAGLAHVGQAEEQGVLLRVDVPDYLPSVNVDTDRMAQVLNNLVANALRHTTKGEVVLGGSVDGDTVKLRVSDTGSGISAEDLPFIFDRFYRADQSRQREDSPASGLGLAIARAIVEAHGGSIEAESTPGNGTTMTISLQSTRSPE